MTGREPLRQPRRIAERDVVEGNVLNAWPERTAYDRPVTVLLLAGFGLHPGHHNPAFFHARGHRPDLLDDGLIGQRVRFAWHRYEGSNTRYLDGQVTVLPPDDAQARVRGVAGPARARAPTGPSSRPKVPPKPS